MNLNDPIIVSISLENWTSILSGDIYQYGCLTIHNTLKRFFIFMQDDRFEVILEVNISADDLENVQNVVVISDKERNSLLNSSQRGEQSSMSYVEFDSSDFEEFFWEHSSFLLDPLIELITTTTQEDTRRKALLGAWILHEIENNSKLKNDPNLEKRFINFRAFLNTENKTEINKIKDIELFKGILWNN